MRNQVSIPRSILLYPYLIIPICTIIALIDLYFHKGLSDVLPGHPSEWFWWILLFGLPHILFSIFLQFNKEYTSVYKKKYFLSFLATLTLILLFHLNPNNLSIIIFNIIYIAFTMYHVLFQQFGINISVNQLIIDYRYALWKWSGFLSVAILFTYQSFKTLNNIESASSIFTIINLEKISLFVLIFSTTLFLTTSIYIIKKTKDALGFCYAGLNIVMILAIVIFSFTPYVVFAIVIPCLLYTSPSPRDKRQSRMPSSA